MKTTKFKTLYMLCAATMVVGTVTGQEFKLSKSSGRLEIRDVNRVTIEGNNGSEIIFSTRGSDREKDKRAEGLRAVSSFGLEDNTGLGLSVVDKGDRVEVHALKRMEDTEFLIKVPKGVTVAYFHTTPYGDDFTIRNFDGNVEVTMVHNDISMSNVTGKLNVKSVHGDIDVVMPNTIANPASITSVHGHVDVSLPTDARLNLKLATAWGEIFVDPGFKLEFSDNGGMRRFSEKIEATLNGGGAELELSSTHSNVYLRKKQ